MTCNAKEKKWTTRWTLTVVDVSKGSRDNRLVLETNVFEDSATLRDKIILKNSGAINSALTNYNLLNKLELTLDDVTIDLANKGSFELKDDA